MTLQCLRASPVYLGSLFCCKVRIQMSPDLLEAAPRPTLERSTPNPNPKVLAKQATERMSVRLIVCESGVFWIFSKNCWERVLVRGGFVIL